MEEKTFTITLLEVESMIETIESLPPWLSLRRKDDEEVICKPTRLADGNAVCISNFRKPIWETVN